MGKITIPYAPSNTVGQGNPIREVASFKAVDGTGTSESFTGAASVDDYQTAYVAKSGANLVLVVKSWPSIGVTKTVTLSVGGKDVAGNDLPVVTQQFDVQGPPPPPLATSIQLGSFGTVNDFTGFPSDPGSGTVSLP
jgi:hypothetical protein